MAPLRLSAPAYQRSWLEHLLLKIQNVQQHGSLDSRSRKDPPTSNNHQVPLF